MEQKFKAIEVKDFTVQEFDAEYRAEKKAKQLPTVLPPSVQLGSPNEFQAELDKLFAQLVELGEALERAIPGSKVIVRKPVNRSIFPENPHGAIHSDQD